MRNSKHAKRSASKVVVLAVALVLLFGLVVGGTLAWLIDSTEEIENTFTVGNIDIDLTETTTTYKMVPGNNIPKDPKITVSANSEACWLFVKVEASVGVILEGTTPAATDYISYAMADGWTALGASYPGVYWRSVDAAATVTDIYVLKGEGTDTLENGYVHVLNTVTKSMMDAIDKAPATAPTLSFTAYAVQKDNVADAVAAWNILNP